jgi:hypothetical protein
MWYFLMKARPKEATDAEQTAGAYVNCWINFQREDGARHLAEYYVTQEGWVIEEIEESKWVGQETYDDNPTGLGYFNEAVQDGASFVFNTWPTNGEDSGD